MSMGAHHTYHLDLCADDEDPSQLIIRPGWDAPHVRCFLRTFCAWPCLLRQVGTVLGSPYDYVVARLAYANAGSRQLRGTIVLPGTDRAAYTTSLFTFLRAYASHVCCFSLALGVGQVMVLVGIPSARQPARQVPL